MSGVGPSTRRRLVESSTLGAGVMLALALLGIVNYFGWKYYQRADWTGSRLYTLSEKSLNVLAGLDRDIEALVFMNPGQPLFDPVRELLSRYEAASPRIGVRVIDAAKNPAEAQALAERLGSAQVDVVVFESGDERRVIDGSDLAEYDYSGFQFGQEPELTAFTGEAAFTGAILELAEDRKPSVRVTTGHGELSLADVSASGMSEARSLLGRDNVLIEPWASLGAPAVPEGTDLVIVPGPTSRFVEPEVAALETFLKSGGRLLVLLDPSFGPDGEVAATGLEELLARYGAEVGRDIVVDPANLLPFYGAETFFANDYGTHPVTRALEQAQVSVILPLARSVREAEGVEGVEVEVLLRTSAEGWAETDMAAIRQGRVEKGDADLAGPVSLGLAVSVPAAEAEAQQADAEGGGETPAGASHQGASQSGEARLVVLGDSDFASNGQLLNASNAELLANAMNWLLERETLVGIAPKPPERVKLALSGAQLRRLTWLVMAVLPGLAILGGIAVYLKRRS